MKNFNNLGNFNILGIETSCDETAAAVYSSSKGILSNAIYSQIELHQKYGGVVPEVASRAHLEKMPLIIDQALTEAKLKLEDIDIIAVTNKPGLAGSLLIGLCYAKGIAWSENKKIIGVNHLEGHIFSACIENNIEFPFLCLTASGGHTALYYVTGYGDYKLLGQTLDDAVGEAFDKVSKLIGLGYPGGPIIERYAAQVNFKDFFQYPRPLSNSYDFSLSGLKTAVLYHLKENGWYNLETKILSNTITELIKQEIASSLLCAITDIFKIKLKKAFKEFSDIKSVAFVGGVSANKYIRSQLKDLCEKSNKKFYVPSIEYCTDNAAMIAFVGNYKALQNKFDSLELDIF